MTKKKVKRDKIQEVFVELNNLEDYIKDKIRVMMEVGILTPDMLTVEHYGDEEEFEVDLDIIYKDGTKSKLTKKVVLEMNLMIREGY